jgi:hypothetical protein
MNDAQPAAAARAKRTPTESRLVPIAGVSRRIPAAASRTQSTSTSRRDVASATPSGPRNSMETAIPRGMRERAS